MPAAGPAPPRRAITWAAAVTALVLQARRVAAGCALQVDVAAGAGASAVVLRRAGRRAALRAPGNADAVDEPGRPIRVLALSPIPEEGAGCRFRIAQFIPYLESVGFEVTLDSLFTPEFFRLVYKPRHYLRKAVTFAALSLKRLDALRDVVAVRSHLPLPRDCFRSVRR